MVITESSLAGLFLIEPTVREDSRGAFAEVLRMDLLAEKGIRPSFVQMNQSTSKANVLRGLHFQWDKPLGKYIRVVRGAAFIAAVDIRKDSPTLGQHYASDVSAENRRALWIPAGFASGFAVVGTHADIEYLYTAAYNPKGESVIRFDDPALGIPWPVTTPIVSDRDAAAGTLADWLARRESEYFRL